MSSGPSLATALTAVEIGVAMTSGARPEHELHGARGVDGGVEPRVPRLPTEHERATVVDTRELAGRRGRDDRRGHEPARGVVVGLGGVLPELVEPGEREGPAVGRVEVVGLLRPRQRTRLGRLPLVVAVRREQCPAQRERALERGLVEQALDAGVDQPVADRRVLRPRRHEPPARGAQLPRERAVRAVLKALGPVDDDADRVGGREVPRRRQEAYVVGDRRDRELVGDLLVLAERGIPTTHGHSVSQTPDACRSNRFAWHSPR
jgi:hypothetical protein